MTWQDDMLKEMNRTQKQMNRFMKYFLSDFPSNSNEMFDELSSDYRKAFTNFKETKNEFVIQLEIPGIEKEDIQIDTTNTGIEIKAEKKQEKENKENGYRYTKNYAGFYQSFNVPKNADLTKLDASYKNGVLTIKLPKKIEIEDKKTIQIR